LIEKFSLYERHGVSEYWVVYPDEKLVMVFRLGENKEYGKPRVYSGKERIAIPMLDHLEIDLSFLERV
jgi:Uma2 family endonuclease